MIEITGIYTNIQKYCLHDGPGIRTTVFLKGCPLRCLWCHNPEAQNREKELLFHEEKCISCGRCLEGCVCRKIENGKLILDRESCTLCGKCVERCFFKINEICGKEAAVDDIIKEVIKDKPFYETSGGGMTISGGEPAMQSAFSLALIREAKKNGISAAIETCGYGTEGFFLQANKEGTLFLFDLKVMNSEKHKKLTGQTNELILSNLEMLFKNGADVIIRLPLIPSVNDSSEDIKKLAEFLNKNRKHYRFAEIMTYHKLGISKEHDLGRESQLNVPEGRNYQEEWIKKFSEYSCEVKISNR